jgi:predicted lipoprotein with Yx(FWY)xxD motif
MNRFRALMIAPVLVTALVAAGCGSANKSSTSSSSAAAPASTSSTSAAANNAYGSGSTTAAAPTATSVAVTTKQAKKLGTVLAAGPKKLTVYLFEADKGPHSSCTGACASAWPPVTGTAKVTGAAMSADLGTITRADGTKQVTYKGHPLYFFEKDKDAGDAYGEAVKAFGAEWYALNPSGKKVDVS